MRNVIIIEIFFLYMHKLCKIFDSTQTIKMYNNYNYIKIELKLDFQLKNRSDLFKV